jgi:hypothetical protein
LADAAGSSFSLLSSLFAVAAVAAATTATATATVAVAAAKPENRRRNFSAGFYYYTFISIFAELSAALKAVHRAPAVSNLFKYACITVIKPKTCFRYIIQKTKQFIYKIISILLYAICMCYNEQKLYDSNNNTFTGNMILLDKYYIVDGSMYLQVNDSESYTCEYLDNSSNFGIINDDIIYANVKGTNVDAVTIHNNGTIELDGMNMDYQISFNVQDDTYRKACITGKSNNITIDKTNLNVTANELNEALDFKMYKNSLLEFDSVSYESAEISSQDAVNILDVIESADIISQEVSQYEQ